MSIDQNNAGIHLIPKQSKKEFINYTGKYPEIIAETNSNNDAKIIEDIKICNFCEIINDKGKKITAAEVIEIDDAIEQFVNFKDYLKDFSEEFY